MQHNKSLLPTASLTYVPLASAEFKRYILLKIFTAG